MKFETTHNMTKGRRIWGWVSAIIGGILILFGLVLAIAGIFSSPGEWYQILLIITLPIWFLAVPLLIYGIRRIKNASGNERITNGKIDILPVTTESMDVESAVVGSVGIEPVDVDAITRKNKKQQVIGWVAAILGGSLIYFGYFALMMGIIVGDSSDWYILFFVLTVPSCLLGIPLLLLGIRKIKNLGENENSENKAKEQKLELVLGWIAAIIGGLLTVLVIASTFYTIVGNVSDGYSELLICATPALLLGIFLLIIGIRRINSLGESASLNAENLARNAKRRHIWGWILALLGMLITLIGFGLLVFFTYVMLILSPLKGIVEPYVGYNLEIVVNLFFFIILPLLLPGFSLLILGFIMLRKKRISRQSRGRLFTIIGLIYLIATVISIFIVERMNINTGGQGTSIMLWSPILLLGILAIVFGIKDMTYKEKLPPETPRNLNEMESEAGPGEIIEHSGS